VLEVLDRFAELGLPIQITEFDVAIRNEDVQAEYLRDFYTAVFSHPATDKIVMWGFFEKVMWKPLGALVRTDWTYKPNYHTYMDLVYNQWWTPDSMGTSDGSGTFGIRGFHGYYDIEFGIGDSVYSIEDLFIDRDTLLEVRPGMSGPGTTVYPGKNTYPEPLSVFPNPAGEEVTLNYALDAPARVDFRFYNMLGQMVKTVSGVHQHPGSFRTTVDLLGLPPGIYLCRAGSETAFPVFNPLLIIKE